jgi:hypothetical protein
MLELMPFAMVELPTNVSVLMFFTVVAVVIVACTAIVFITDHLRKTRQSEIEAWLKHDMLERGMNAEDIRTVLEARIDGEETRLAHIADQGVHIGLGKLQLNVGGKPQPVSTTG